MKKRLLFAAILSFGMLVTEAQATQLFYDKPIIICDINDKKADYLYQSIESSYESIYMTIMDYSNEYTHYMYSMDLVSATANFFIQEVDDIISIHYDAVRQKMVINGKNGEVVMVKFNHTLTNVDNVIVKFSPSESERMYINNYNELGHSIDYLDSYSSDNAKFFKGLDGYGNTIIHLMDSEKLIVDIQPDSNYSQAKAIYAFATYLPKN